MTLGIDARLWTLPEHTATELFIGGQWREASDGGTFTDLNPATDRPLAQIAAATAQDIDDAVRAARAQLGGEWGSLPGAARGRMLNKVADLIERDGEILARLEALDVGKPVGQPDHARHPDGRRHVPALRRLGRQDHRRRPSRRPATSASPPTPTPSASRSA